MNGIVLALLLTGQQCQIINGRQVCAAPSQVIRSRIDGPIAAIDPAYASVCVRIENHRPGSITYGSGVILTRSGLVLTCKHIFRGGTGRLVVRRSDGAAWEAAFIATDPSHDLGAIAITNPGNIPTVKYANYQPSRAVIVGYPEDGMTPQARMGQFREAASVFYSVDSQQGVSGGPVFQVGTLGLAGVLWGARSDGVVESAVVPIVDVRRFLMTEACFRFFRRQPKQINVNVTGVAPPVTPIPPVVVDPPPVVTPTPVTVSGPQGPPGPMGPAGPPGAPAPTAPPIQFPDFVMAVKSPNGVTTTHTFKAQTDPKTGKSAYGILLDLNPPPTSP